MIDCDDVDADFGADAKVDSQPGFLNPAWSSLVAAYRQLTKVGAWWSPSQSWTLINHLPTSRTKFPTIKNSAPLIWSHLPSCSQYFKILKNEISTADRPWETGSLGRWSSQPLLPLLYSGGKYTTTDLDICKKSFSAKPCFTPDVQLVEGERSSCWKEVKQRSRLKKKLIALSKKAGKPGRAGRWGGCDRQLLWTWSFSSGELWCTEEVKLSIFKRKINIKATDQKGGRMSCYHFFRWMTKTWCQYQGMCSGSMLRGLAVFLSTAGLDLDC